MPEICDNILLLPVGNYSFDPAHGNRLLFRLDFLKIFALLCHFCHVVFTK